MTGINLHGVVRGAITTIHPDEDVILYQSAGSTNIAGKVLPKYQEGKAIKMQIQSLSEKDLYLLGLVGSSEVRRRFYTSTTAGNRVSGVVRPKAKGDDLIHRLSDDTWFRVESVQDDFSRVAWSSVIGVLQVEAPDFTHSDWYDKDVDP